MNCWSTNMDATLKVRFGAWDQSRLSTQLGRSESPPPGDVITRRDRDGPTAEWPLLVNR